MSSAVAHFFTTSTLTVNFQFIGGNVVYEAIWPLLWCSIIGVLDTSLGLQPNNSLFYMSYLHSQPGFRNRKAITSSSAPLCVSYLQGAV